jgi:hypothetical protein
MHYCKEYFFLESEAAEVSFLAHETRIVVLRCELALM